MVGQGHALDLPYSSTAERLPCLAGLVRGLRSAAATAVVRLRRKERTMTAPKKRIKQTRSYFFGAVFI
jgi:hypothetical protein